MKLSEKIKQAITTSEDYIRLINDCEKNNANLSFNDVIYASIKSEKCGAQICVGIECEFLLNNNTFKKVKQFYFKIGIATKSNYFSSKKIPVIINDNENLTESELTELMDYFNTNTKENTFDPFWFENNQQSKNAHALNVIATKLQPDCRC
jgi:hypothetical protein